MAILNKAIFIDRDGVINSDEGHYYIFKPEDLVLNPNVATGLKRLQDAGFLIIVITNQGGISKGVYTHNDVALVHKKLKKLLAQNGVELTEIYYCPHHSDNEKCLCRKPGIINIQKAIARFDIDATLSWMVGDNLRDVEAGIAAGLKTIKAELNGDFAKIADQILKS